MTCPFRPQTLVALCLLVFANSLSGGQNRLLAGHVPPAVGHIASSGRFGSSNRLNLALGLPLRNPQGLDNLLKQLYDPATPDFRHFLTPEQFVGQFGPSADDYERVVAFAVSNGLTISHKHSNRLLVSVSGSVGDIEKAFHIQLLNYPHPNEPRTFYAPDTEPSVADDVPIFHVAGLDNFIIPRRAHSTASDHFNGPVPQGGSGSGGSFLGSDFRNAYAPGVTLTGAGQTVGLVEFDGYYTNDITAYETLAGLSNTTISNILLDGFVGAPGIHNSEVALDIELVLSMAPGLSRVVVYNAGPQGSPDDIIGRMATDNVAQQLSSSWIWGANDDPIADQIFTQFAAQGQSFFNSSGDTDAYTASIPFPADNPFITIVGGTSLSTAVDKSWSAETAWNLNNGQGSGGGISPRYQIPTWQQGLNFTNNQGSATQRNIPDVAMVASQVWGIYNNGQGSAFFGTSCGAPLWAAFTALVNQQGAIYGQPPVGFLNPAIYTIGRSTNYGACFHDITVGNNTNNASSGKFLTVAGYDLCTGWGSPVGQALINALQPPDYLVISPQAGFTANGLPGGPFNPSAEAFSLTNHGTVPLNWSAGTSAPWLSISPTNGALASNSPAAQVNVNLNSGALAMAAGSYAADVWFTNLTTGVGRIRHFNLVISPSLILNGGFETGDFSNWILNASSNADFVSGSGFTTPHSGNKLAVLEQGFLAGYLSQTVATTPGQPYLLSFWLENPSNGIPNEFVVNWSPSLGVTNNIFNQTNLSSFIWTNFQFLVMATGTNATLQFGFRNDPFYFGLDDIDLTAVPGPKVQIVNESPSTVIIAWPAFPGLSYQVQYESDLSQTNWQNLGSSITASNSSLFISDSTASQPARFYRVVVNP